MKPTKFAMMRIYGLILCSSHASRAAKRRTWWLRGPDWDGRFRLFWRERIKPGLPQVFPDHLSIPRTRTRSVLHVGLLLQPSRVSPWPSSPSDTRPVANTHGAQCSLDRDRRCRPHPCPSPTPALLSRPSWLRRPFPSVAGNWQRCCTLLVSLLFVLSPSFGSGGSG